MGTIAVKVGPCDVEIIDDDRVAAAVRRDGQFEPQSLKWWGAFCEKGKAEFVIDVGSYGGLFCIAARVMKNDVLAIEPKPIMARRTLANAALNGVEVHLIEAAASTSNGYAELGFNPGIALTSGSSLERKGPATMKVRTVTLDSLILDFPAPVTAIKIDVEGHEAKVLLGARKLLQQFKPHILIETMADDNRKTEVLEILKGTHICTGFLDGRNLLMEPIK